MDAAGRAGFQVPEDGAVPYVGSPVVESLQTEVVDLIVVATESGGERSRLHLLFDLGFGEDVQPRALRGRQVDLVGIVQFESRRRHAPGQEIDRLVGIHRRVSRRYLVDFGRQDFVPAPPDFFPAIDR